MMNAPGIGEGPQQANEPSNNRPTRQQIDHDNQGGMTVRPQQGDDARQAVENPKTGGCAHGDIIRACCQKTIPERNCFQPLP